METLDKVIKVMSVCDETQRLICIECPYTVDCEDVPGKKLRADALYYLQKYQEHYKAHNDQVERYQKAAQQCGGKPIGRRENENLRQAENL